MKLFTSNARSKGVVRPLRRPRPLTPETPSAYSGDLVRLLRLTSYKKRKTLAGSDEGLDIY